MFVRALWMFISLAALGARLSAGIQDFAEVAEAFSYPVSPVGDDNQLGFFRVIDTPWNGSSSGQFLTTSPTDQSHFHLANDWNISGGSNADCGLPVYAAGDGYVVYVRRAGTYEPHNDPFDINHNGRLGNPKEPWGQIVILLHFLPDGRKVRPLYAHLQVIEEDIALGARVYRGTKIGTIGDGEGAVRSCHLHFEVRTEEPYTTDPLPPNPYQPIDSKYVRLNTDPTAFVGYFNRRPASFALVSPANHATINPARLEWRQSVGPDYLNRQIVTAVTYDLYIDNTKYKTQYARYKWDWTMPTVVFDLPKLLPSGKHHWYVEARNFFGTTRSQIWDFTISSDGVGGSAEDPATNIVTGAAENIGETTARLTGEVIPYGSTTNYHFEYGTSTSYGHSTSTGDAGRGYRWVEVGKTIRNLTCGTIYQYRLVAENSRNQTFEGADRTFTTDDCTSSSAQRAPAVRLSVGTVACGQVFLWWNTEENGHYSLWRGGVEVWVGNASGKDSTQVFVDSDNLIPGHGYDYEIRASNEFGQNTDALHFFYPPYICGGEGGPPTEFILRVSPHRCDANSPTVLLEWTPLYESDTLYRIYKEDGTLLAEVDAAKSGPAYVIREGLAVGQFYSFYVEGYDHQGNAVRTNTTTAYITSDRCQLGGNPTLPPGDFLVWNEPVTCVDGLPQVRLRWTESAGALSYRLERFREDLTVSVNGIPDTTYLDTDRIKKGSLHSYIVYAVNQAGETTGGQVLRNIFVPSDICGDEGLPGEFLLYLEEPYCSGGNPAIRMNWFPPEGNVSTSHAWRLAGGAASGKINTAYSGFTKYTFETSAGLSAGQSYGIFMEVKDAADLSKTRQSNTVWFSIPPDVCAPPSAPPAVQTQPARGVSIDAALLAGSVNPNGSSATAYFEWGLTTSYGHTTASRMMGNGTLYLAPEIIIGGLTCGTSYHFRTVAANAFGIIYGPDREFSTVPCPPPPPVISIISQGQPGQPGKDIWTTSYYSYAPMHGTPGGGLDDDRLRVGGWGDSYYSLIEFNLGGLPQHARTARIELFSRPQQVTTAMYLDRITQFWDWRIQGTGSDRERLWWANRPAVVQWRSGTLPAPTPEQWYSIDITDLYNGWQVGTYPNYGVQLRPVSNSNTWAEFYSANAADQALRPRLVIESDAFPPGFTRISDMTSPRQFHCAVRLNNGKVLLAGGWGTNKAMLSSAELYDPATRTYSTTGGMHIARGRGVSCARLDDGRVLVAGGETSRFVYTATAELYDPATGIFTTVGNMTTPRGEGWKMIAVPGGALLFGGTFEGNLGTATAAVDRFTSASATFSRVGTLAGARRDYTAQMFADGTALLVGGVLRFDLPVSLAAELYDSSTNQSVATGQPAHAPRVRSFGSALLPGGDVLVTSGAGFAAEIYRRASRSFETVPGAPALYAGDFGTALSLADGHILLLGYGRTSGEGGRRAEVFDPTTNTFSAIGPFAVSGICEGYVSTLLQDGTVLVTGGGFPPLCDSAPLVEIFNPVGL